MPWDLPYIKMAGEGSPQLNSPLMQDSSPQAEATPHGELKGVIIDIKKPNTGWRLRYQDILPHGNGPDEPYKCLIERANEWLRKNTDCHVNTVESVTWTNAKESSLGDTEQVVLSTSIAENTHTYVRRGLRLWLTPRKDNKIGEQLGYEDFIPDKNDSFHSLVNKANRKIDKGGIEGKLITIESFSVLVNQDGMVDSSVTNYSEPANDDIPHAFILRLFFLCGPCSRENIGIKDFIPSPSMDGYEPFAQLIEKANTWLRDQPDLRVTGMQSLMVQKDNGPHSETGSACFYMMPGLHNEDPVEFFRILRLAFAKPTGDALAEVPVIYPFTFESFTPELVVPKNGKKKERMEKMKETFRRMSDYMRTSELDVVCAETVLNPMQMVIDDRGRTDGNDDQMKWLVTLRLYLSGQITSMNDVDRNIDPSMLERAPSRRKGNPRRKKKDSEDHPGPIFLRHVTTGQRPYRMMIAFGTAFVALSIIVILSVVYSNQS